MHDTELKVAARNMRSKGKSYNEIGRNLGISRFAARNLVNYKHKNVKRKVGPKQKITKSIKLRIKSEICRLQRSNEKVHASKLMSNLQINASVRTVQRHMRRNGYIYKKAKRNIELHDLHKEKRINECRIWIASNHNWERTIFSDEKRFCCDGPDNWNSYCQKGQYLRRQRRQCSGGSVMVWIMVLPSGLLSHHILQGTFTSQKYVDLLRRYVVPVIKLNYKSPIYFQQDNSSVHKAKMVTQFFNSNTIPLISWPSRSPDLNIAENV